MQGFKNITRITATRCCVCHRTLTDAESVEHGIGPVCSRRYYNPKHKPTEEMVQSALGLLCHSELPYHIIEGFRKLVKNSHINARLGSNFLVYWAACKYHDRKEVFKCSRIIRELGYTELADKLETDRTDITLLKDKDLGMYSLAFINHFDGLFDDALEKIPGSVNTHTKIGRKFVWQIPTDQRKYLGIILGIFYGGKMACGTKKDGTTGIWTIFRQTRQHLRNYKEGINKKKDVYLFGSEAISYDEDKLYIDTPYNLEFLTALKSKVPYNHRLRNRMKRRWEVSKTYKNVVIDLVLSHYGVKL